MYNKFCNVKRGVVAHGHSGSDVTSVETLSALADKSVDGETTSAKGSFTEQPSLAALGRTSKVLIRIDELERALLRLSTSVEEGFNRLSQAIDRLDARCDKIDSAVAAMNYKVEAIINSLTDEIEEPLLNATSIATNPESDEDDESAPIEPGKPFPWSRFAKSIIRNHQRPDIPWLQKACSGNLPPDLNYAHTIYPKEVSMAVGIMSSNVAKLMKLANSDYSEVLAAVWNSMMHAAFGNQTALAANSIPDLTSLAEDQWNSWLDRQLSSLDHLSDHVRSFTAAVADHLASTGYLISRVQHSEDVPQRDISITSVTAAIHDALKAVERSTARTNTSIFEGMIKRAYNTNVQVYLEQATTPTHMNLGSQSFLVEAATAVSIRAVSNNVLLQFRARQPWPIPLLMLPAILTAVAYPPAAPRSYVVDDIDGWAATLAQIWNRAMHSANGNTTINYPQPFLYQRNHVGLTSTEDVVFMTAPVPMNITEVSTTTSFVATVVQAPMAQSKAQFLIYVRHGGTGADPDFHLLESGGTWYQDDADALAVETVALQLAPLPDPLLHAPTPAIVNKRIRCLCPIGAQDEIRIRTTIESTDPLFTASLVVSGTVNLGVIAEAIPNVALAAPMTPAVFKNLHVDVTNPTNHTQHAMNGNTAVQSNIVDRLLNRPTEPDFTGFLFDENPFAPLANVEPEPVNVPQQEVQASEDKTQKPKRRHWLRDSPLAKAPKGQRCVTATARLLDMLARIIEGSGLGRSLRKAALKFDAELDQMYEQQKHKSRYYYKLRARRRGQTEAASSDKDGKTRSSELTGRQDAGAEKAVRAHDLTEQANALPKQAEHLARVIPPYDPHIMQWFVDAFITDIHYLAGTGGHRELAREKFLLHSRTAMWDVAAFEYYSDHLEGKMISSASEFYKLYYSVDDSGFDEAEARKHNKAMHALNGNPFPENPTVADNYDDIVKVAGEDREYTRDIDPKAAVLMPSNLVGDSRLSRLYLLTPAKYYRDNGAGARTLVTAMPPERLLQQSAFYATQAALVLTEVGAVGAADVGYYCVAACKEDFASGLLTQLDQMVIDALLKETAPVAMIPGRPYNVTTGGYMWTNYVQSLRSGSGTRYSPERIMLVAQLYLQLASWSSNEFQDLPIISQNQCQDINSRFDGNLNQGAGPNLFNNDVDDVHGSSCGGVNAPVIPFLDNATQGEICACMNIEAAPQNFRTLAVPQQLIRHPKGGLFLALWVACAACPFPMFNAFVAYQVRNYNGLGQHNKPFLPSANRVVVPGYSNIALILPADAVCTWTTTQAVAPAVYRNVWSWGPRGVGVHNADDALQLYWNQNPNFRQNNQIYPLAPYIFSYLATEMFTYENVAEFCSLLYTILPTPKDYFNTITEKVAFLTVRFPPVINTVDGVAAGNIGPTYRQNRDECTPDGQGVPRVSDYRIPYTASARMAIDANNLDAINGIIFGVLKPPASCMVSEVPVRINALDYWLNVIGYGRTLAAAYSGLLALVGSSASDRISNVVAGTDTWGFTNSAQIAVTQAIAPYQLVGTPITLEKPFYRIYSYLAQGRPPAAHLTRSLFNSVIASTPFYDAQEAAPHGNVGWHVVTPLTTIWCQLVCQRWFKNYDTMPASTTAVYARADAGIPIQVLQLALPAINRFYTHPTSKTDFLPLPANRIVTIDSKAQQVLRFAYLLFRQLGIAAPPTYNDYTRNNTPIPAGRSVFDYRYYNQPIPAPVGGLEPVWTTPAAPYEALCTLPSGMYIFPLALYFTEAAIADIIAALINGTALPAKLPALINQVYDAQGQRINYLTDQKADLSGTVFNNPAPWVDDTVRTPASEGQDKAVKDGVTVTAKTNALGVESEATPDLNDANNRTMMKGVDVSAQSNVSAPV